MKKLNELIWADETLELEDFKASSSASLVNECESDPTSLMVCTTPMIIDCNVIMSGCGEGGLSGTYATYSLQNTTGCGYGYTNGFNAGGGDYGYTGGFTGGGLIGGGYVGLYTGFFKK